MVMRQQRQSLGPNPFISVIIATLNEESHIEDALSDILGADYPSDKMEVFVVDGRSSDNTRPIVERIALTDKRVQLLDNPDRLKPIALNLAIAQAKGEVVMWVGAHARYPTNYVPRLVSALDEYDCDNTGALLRANPPIGLVERALATLVESKFAAGNTPYRTGAREPREVASVFGGCYRREVFDVVGGFDTRLVRCQDREFNDRLLKAGGRIVLDPGVECTYFARREFFEFFRWQAEGGEWVFRAGFVTGRPIVKARNFAPLAFLAYLIGLAATTVLPVPRWARRVAALPGVAYLGLDVRESAQIASRHKRPALVALLIPLFPINHVAYGVGTTRALYRRFVRGKRD